MEQEELFRLAAKPGDKIGLQSLINALTQAKDGTITGTVFLRNKVKYNIEIPFEGKKFRLSNVEPFFNHPPFDNGFHYNDNIAIETRRQNEESPFNHAGWHDASDLPKKNGGKDAYASVEVICDVNGKRKDFRVGWYDLEDKEWRFHDTDRSWLEEEHLKWAYLPLV